MLRNRTQEQEHAGTAPDDPYLRRLGRTVIVEVTCEPPVSGVLSWRLLLAQRRDHSVHF